MGKSDCFESINGDDRQINRYPNNLRGKVNEHSDFKCSFQPENDPRNPASIMYAHYLKDSKFIMENSDNSYYNPNFINEENRLCNGLNSWEIMSKHEDFNGPFIKTSIVDPNFTIIQQQPLRIALLIDLSKGNFNVNIKEMNNFLNYNLSLLSPPPPSSLSPSLYLFPALSLFLFHSHQRFLHIIMRAFIHF